LGHQAAVVSPRAVFNQKEILMRLLVLGVVVFLAACSAPSSNLPTSPTAALAGSSVQSTGPLPLRGSFTLDTTGVATFPILLVNGTAEGTASQLGLFTATIAEVVDMLTATSTGTFNFVAANGDQLSTTTVGGEEAFIPPNVSHVREVATIVGGTGRFAGATGTVTILWSGAIDFAAGTSTGSGSFEGQITLRK
jgi:hypothetical protein